MERNIFLQKSPATKRRSKIKKYDRAQATTATCAKAAVARTTAQVKRPVACCKERRSNKPDSFIRPNKNFNACVFQVGGGVSTTSGGYLQPRQANPGGGKGGGGVGGGEEGKEVLQSLHERREGGGG